MKAQFEADFKDWTVWSWFLQSLACCELEWVPSSTSALEGAPHLCWKNPPRDCQRAGKQSGTVWGEQRQPEAPLTAEHLPASGKACTFHSGKADPGTRGTADRGQSSLQATDSGFLFRILCGVWLFNINLPWLQGVAAHLGVAELLHLGSSFGSVHVCSSKLSVWKGALWSEARGIAQMYV